MSGAIQAADAAQRMTTQSLTDEQVALITRTIAKGASRDELELFVAQCNRTGLDPFSRQIYLIPRWDSQTRSEVRQVQISIDGARLTAQRSGEYAGQDGPYWCGKDGVWRDVWLSDEPPVAAKVGVRRRGFDAPVYAVALWSEYAQTKRDGSLTAMWQRMRALMLAKCAEMLALRKGFPAELSGLYSAEEMPQADAEQSPAPSVQARAAPERLALPPAEAAPAEPLAPAAPAKRRSKAAADAEALMDPTPVAARGAAPAAPAAAPAAPAGPSPDSGWGQSGSAPRATLTRIKTHPLGRALFVEIDGLKPLWVQCAAAAVEGVREGSAASISYAWDAAGYYRATAIGPAEQLTVEEQADLMC